ncbi:putative signal transducing protein [Chloroflexota bacterium]
MSKSKGLVVVYQAVGDMEAQIIKGLLESYRIPCLLKSHVACSVHTFAVDGMGEVRVMVQEPMANKATQLIWGKDNV